MALIALSRWVFTFEGEFFEGRIEEKAVGIYSKSIPETYLVVEDSEYMRDSVVISSSDQSLARLARECVINILAKRAKWGGKYHE